MGWNRIALVPADVTDTYTAVPDTQIPAMVFEAKAAH